MDTDKIPIGLEASPWKPIDKPLHVALLGKMLEETAELIEASVVVLGYSNPPSGNVVTIFTARHALEEEMADVLALIYHCHRILYPAGHSFSARLALPHEEKTPLAAALVLLTQFQKALARCLIQGLEESDPATGLRNFDLLDAHITKVRNAQYELIERLSLNREAISVRIEKKYLYLTTWFDVLR